MSAIQTLAIEEEAEGMRLDRWVKIGLPEAKYR